MEPYRVQVLDRLVGLVVEIESLRGGPPESKIRETLTKWEAKEYAKNDRVEYDRKVKEKCRTAQAQLAELKKPPQRCKPSAWESIPFKVVDDLRVPMDECRILVRIVNVFVASSPEFDELKENFLHIYTDISNQAKKLKSKQITQEAADATFRTELDNLKELRQKLNPLVDGIMRDLDVWTLEELFALDSQLFGLIERYWSVHGVGSVYKKRLQGASKMIGSAKSIS